MARLSNWWNFHHKRLKEVQSLVSQGKSLKLDLDFQESQDFLKLLESKSKELLDLFPVNNNAHSIITRNIRNKIEKTYFIYHNENSFIVRTEGYPSLLFKLEK